MNTNRRTALIAATGSLLAAGRPMAQEAFPAKPIRWVIGTAAGGGSDIVARTIAIQLGQQLGQQIIVDNRPGGGTTIAADYVARSPADGYTVMTADVGTLVFNQALFKKLSYVPMKDLASVGTLAKFPLMLAVGGDSQFNDIRSLMDAIRANPGKYSYASPGVGSPHHLAVEMLKEEAKLVLPHVPYKGGAPAVQDTVAGVVPMMVVDTATGSQMIKAGRLKPLASMMSTRMADFPNVPTLMELGYTRTEAAAWQGMVVPAATPKEVVQRLSTELQRAIQSPTVLARLRDLGLEPLPSTPEQMTQLWTRDNNYWPALIRTRGISAD